ncbi:MAG: GIY-YIG nuclease family protein, partial [Culicoidibacterales bacterium]
MLVTVYKTTNLINGKYYIGVHRVKNESCINDSYLGSGVCIKKAFKKHGKSNFKKEVLFVYDNYESAYLKEAELVTEETIKMKSVYNQYPGGLGGR